MFDDIQQTIRDYTEEIRQHTSNEDGNLLSLTWGECITYLKFLQTIHDRYEVNFKQFLEIGEQRKAMFSKHPTGSHTMDQEEMDIFARSSELITQLRLDIESFLVFTAVLLNKLTNFPNRYLRHTALRGITCGSHHQFWKTIMSQGNFPNPPIKELLDNVKWLQENVIDFRDDLIMHTLRVEQIERQLIKGFTHGPKKGGSIMTGALYPDMGTGEPKQYQSTELNQIVEKLREFVIQVIAFYRDNDSVSIFEK